MKDLKILQLLLQLMLDNPSYGTKDALNGNKGLCLMAFDIGRDYPNTDGTLKAHIKPLRTRFSKDRYWFNTREERIEALQTAIAKLQNHITV